MKITKRQLRRIIKEEQQDWRVNQMVDSLVAHLDNPNVMDMDSDEITDWLVKLYDLPNKQFELFVELCSKPGKVFKREHLYRKIWGTELNNGNRTLDVHIRGIRSILSTNCIKTVKGVGYKVH